MVAYQVRVHITFANDPGSVAELWCLDLQPANNDTETYY